ncbi:retrovirus-related pol polyprotein from transposon TNT 1-94 [Tanacetum coccineum]
MVTKFDIDKFDGKISFAIWKVHMQAVLTHHGYKKALRGIAHKPQSMSDEDSLELDKKALATIQLFLTREVLCEVIHETTMAGLWLKLESLYMTKSLVRIKDVDMKFEDKDYDDDVEPKSDEGLVARGRSSDRGKSSNKNKKHRSQSRGKYSNKSCKYCKKLGHIVSDCYKLKNKLEREGKGNKEKKPKKTAEVAIAKGDSDGDVYLAIDTEKSRDELIVDSGCTFHMIPHRSWLTTYESFNGGNVYMGNHFICHVIGKGNIQVKMHDGVVRTITGVRHIPDLKRNLISLSTLEANGCKYSGEGGVMKIFKGDLVLMKAIQSGGLYVTWVRKGYERTLPSKCLIKTRDALDYIHSDLWGPSPVMSRGVLIENQTRKKIKKLRTDNGLEFCGESFNALCRKYGIARHHTLVRTPQQNGVAERINRTIMEKVQCMLSHAILDKDFWVEAATTATYLINRSPHRSLNGNIPEILWSGNSVDYSNLRVFGCPVYVHVDEGKLVPRAVKFIFLGYGSGVKGYRVWCPNPKYRKIIHSRDVTFNEDVIINLAISSPECDKWVVAIKEEVKDGILGVESKRYKARYVVRGFDQRGGIDFNEVLYVDDMLIAAPNKDQIKELKDQLSNEFDMKDSGAAKRILGMEI